VVEAILKHDRDIIAIATTGSGKTLTFWMPLLFKRDGIQIVVTPLNILGKQNVESLARMGIQGITVTSENATMQTFKVIKYTGKPELMSYLYINRTFENLKYQVIVTNIETFDKVDGGFNKLWKHELFTSHVISIIWDEGHCVSKWADFCPEYKTAGQFCHLILQHIPFYVTSVTLPPVVLQDVTDTLHIRTDSTYLFERSNNCANIGICVCEMVHPANSYLDLAFLIPENSLSGWRPPRFLIFFDDIAESIAVAKFL